MGRTALVTYTCDKCGATEELDHDTDLNPAPKDWSRITVEGLANIPDGDYFLCSMRCAESIVREQLGDN
jgi:hypothetical protein